MAKNNNFLSNFLTILLIVGILYLLYDRLQSKDKEEEETVVVQTPYMSPWWNTYPYGYFSSNYPWYTGYWSGGYWGPGYYGGGGWVDVNVDVNT